VAIGKLFGFDGSTFKGWLEAGVSLGRLLAAIFNFAAKVIVFALKPVIWTLTLIVKAITKVIEWLKKLIDWSKKAVNVIKKSLEVGKHIVGGIAQGVKGATHKAWNAVKNVGHSIVNGFKSLFGIKSPSRLFMSFGANLLEGLFLGIKKFQHKPVSVISQLAKTIGGAFKNLLPPVLNFDVTQKVEGETLVRPVVGGSRHYSKSVLINKLVDRLEVVVNGSVRGEPKEIAKAIVEVLESSLEKILWRF
jgi:phage-related protein